MRPAHALVLGSLKAVSKVVDRVLSVLAGNRKETNKPFSRLVSIALLADDGDGGATTVLAASGPPPPSV